MTRYKLECAYHGARFHGWQRQPNSRTVQGELEMWLGRLLNRSEDSVNLNGAGRTDAGVHAEQMVAHFDFDQSFDVDLILNRLRAALPPDLVVSSLARVNGDFHARYCARWRIYSYTIQSHPNPFGRDRSWAIASELSADILITIAGSVLGEHDFRGFCLAGSQKEDCRCVVHDSRWKKSGTQWEYRIKADRFLHQMVRLLVGTMVDAALGRMPAARVSEILAGGDVRLCGSAAPPHGLTLLKIGYSGDEE